MVTSNLSTKLDHFLISWWHQMGLSGNSEGRLKGTVSHYWGLDNLSLHMSTNRKGNSLSMASYFQPHDEMRPTWLRSLLSRSFSRDRFDSRVSAPGAGSKILRISVSRSWSTSSRDRFRASTSDCSCDSWKFFSWIYENHRRVGLATVVIECSRFIIAVIK